MAKLSKPVGARPLKAVSNPPNPWLKTRIDWVGAPPEATLEVYEERSRSILSRNDSPDIPFTWSLNPYRGCYHACAYCYARPTHEYLDLGAGTDFDRRLVVKPEAPRLLREAFDRPAWKGQLLVFSGNTDCYQPLEASYRLTRACLEVCRDYRNPVSIITKSALVERDVDVFEDLSAVTYCAVVVSVPFFDRHRARIIEPHAPTPERRIQAIGRLARAGLAVGVNVAPVIPGLNDADLPQILAVAREAGASFAGIQMVRLPGPVREVFEERLKAGLPLRAERVLNQIRDCRGGRLNDAEFGSRMRGRGQRWSVIERLFRRTKARLGYGARPPPPHPSPFRRPGQPRQLELL
jgi:DNA repair photolyase